MKNYFIHKFNLLLIRLGKFIKRGPDLKSISANYDDSLNKSIKHTGYANDKNKTLYYATFYHYLNNIPKIIKPEKVDCLLAQSYADHRFLNFKGPKVYYTLEPNSNKERSTIELLKKINEDKHVLSFNDPSSISRLYYPSIRKRKSHIEQLHRIMSNERTGFCAIINRYSENKNFDLVHERNRYVEAFYPHIDIYGREPWEGENKWNKYSTYRGRCSNKRKTLLNYVFNLCFENSYEDGYISEKIIDSLMAGCIPIYWGGGAYLLDTIPSDCYVNCRDLEPKQVLQRLLIMPHSEVITYREAGIKFLSSKKASPFEQKDYRIKIINKLRAQL